MFILQKYQEFLPYIQIRANKSEVEIMKKVFFSYSNIFLFWLIILAARPIFAQNPELLIEGEPEQVTDEIVGLRDVNGKFCAAIQVISSLNGFKYDSYNGVVKVDHNPGKDIVYLSPNERVLEIYHSGHKPLKIILYEVGIQLDEKEMWKINIKSPIIKKISVTIITDPLISRRYIDGNYLGFNEVLKLQPGKHFLKVEKEGYKTLTDSINVSEDNNMFMYDLQAVDAEVVEKKKERKLWPWITGAIVTGAGTAALIFLGGDGGGSDQDPIGSPPDFPEQ